MAKTKKWRFYRSNLETIVWDPRASRPLADFSEGHFITEREDVRDRLRELGYPEVALDAEVPPDIMFGKGIILEGDVKIMPGAVNEAAALNKEMAQAAAARAAEADDDDGDDGASPVPARVKKKKSKSTTTKKKKVKKSDKDEKPAKKKAKKKTSTKKKKKVDD